MDFSRLVFERPRLVAAAPRAVGQSLVEAGMPDGAPGGWPVVEHPPGLPEPQVGLLAGTARVIPARPRGDEGGEERGIVAVVFVELVGVRRQGFQTGRCFPAVVRGEQGPPDERVLPE